MWYQSLSIEELHQADRRRRRPHDTRRHRTGRRNSGVRA